MLSADDPLVPPPRDWFTDPRDAPPGVDPLERLAEAVGDYFSFNAIALPAFGADGVAVVPPDEHVLDWLARAYDLVDDDVAGVRPAADTVYVEEGALADCDLCGRAARYDTFFDVRAGEPVGGYACEACLRERGDHTLGAGHSTYMLTADEVSSAVRDVVAELCRRANKPPIWT